MSIIYKNSHKESWSNRLYRLLIVEKMNNMAGLILLLLLGLAVALVMGSGGTTVSMLIVLGLLGLPIGLLTAYHLNFGIAATLSISFFLLGVGKYIGDPPVGILLDTLILLLLVGLLLRLVLERDWRFMKSWASLIILVWISYNVIEVINPTAPSRLAWLYTVRRLAAIVMMYYVAAYAFSGLRQVRTIVVVLIVWAALAACYGIWQEIFGFNAAEMAWLYQVPDRMELIFQWGRFRRFSFLSDPTTFGIMCAAMAVFCTVLVMGTYRLRYKIWLIPVIMLLLAAMVFSGTRTAYAMLPVGALFYVLLNPNFRNVLLTAIGALGFVALILVPTGNVELYRFQSAFKGSEDKSFELRLNNQKRIQPFIQEHVMGGGLGSSGEWGKRFAPDFILAKFPPDSGFVRIAVELGWLGLLIYCLMFFLVLQVGIYNYMRVRNPEIKNLYQAFLCLIFTLTIANYPQEAVILVPNSLIYFIAVAALVRLKDFDRV
ncbi:MAG: O-antigen ligase family protein [Sphingobacteriales bacterium]|nr:O-antigen ligase family protein [Sphingobacteriales bacterium]